jgi:hypothetical protein
MRGRRIVKKVGCGYIFVSLSRLLIIISDVFLDASYVSLATSVMGRSGYSTSFGTPFPMTKVGASEPGPENVSVSESESDVYPELYSDSDSDEDSSESDKYGL